MSRPAIFIDEDSALLDGVPAGPYDEPQFRPHAQAALTALSAHGYALVLLCNDGGRRLARWTGSEFVRHHQHLQGVIEGGDAGVTDVMTCTHVPRLDGKRACDCRLPRAGLLLEAARRHDLAMDRCWLIAGGKRTRRAARRAGCRSMRLGSGPKSDARDLMKAVRLILKHDDPVAGMAIS